MAAKENFDAHLVGGGKRGMNWFKSTSPYGYNIAACVSALVKEIRRGNEKEAIFWGHQVAISGKEAERFLWEILRVVCIEDCGVANPMSITALSDTMQLYFDLPEREDRRYATLAFAIVYLARSKKSRYSTELFQKVTIQLREENFRPKIPNYAIDFHLPDGRAIGRDLFHYLSEAAELANENKSFPRTARKWLLDRARNKRKI